MEMHKFEKFFVNNTIFNLIYKKTVYNSFLNFIGKELEGKLLEIGCGIGKTTHFLAGRYKKLKITAIDYDKEQVSIAKKNKKLKNIDFKQGDATSLNFKSNSFDYAIETNVLHHIKNYEAAIKEISRVLKKGGYFYMMDASQHVFSLPIIRFLFPPESSITKNLIIEKLEKNNFKVEKSKNGIIFFIAARKVTK